MKKLLKPKKEKVSVSYSPLPIEIEKLRCNLEGK